MLENQQKAENSKVTSFSRKLFKSSEDSHSVFVAGGWNLHHAPGGDVSRNSCFSGKWAHLWLAIEIHLQCLRPFPSTEGGPIS
jgi:hypothetical protein